LREFAQENTVSGNSLERNQTLLRTLGFEFTPDRLPELLEESVREEHSLPEFLENILTQERHAREERRVRTALKLSGLSLGKTLEENDYSIQQDVNTNQID